MREPADLTRIRQFMRRLGGEARGESRVYFTGGATAVLHGWRPSTLDIDIRLEPERDELFRAIPALKEQLRLNVELASPADFIPVRPDWEAEGREREMRYPAYMQRIVRAAVLTPALFLLACSQPSAQSQDTEALRKEIEALKASQEAMQKDLAEIREFLRMVTGGKFGAPPIEGQTVDLNGAPARGPESAPLTLVEVSDYHCPFCRRHFQQTQPQIYANYVDQGAVRHVFVHYPIDQLHPEAFRSHEAASCAADQGKFWELHTKLFEAPARSVDQILALAGPAGLDVAALKACMESGKYSETVRESVKRMQQLGVDSTPMFLIGKTPQTGEPMKILKVVRGAHPFDQFKTAIESIQ